MYEIHYEINGFWRVVAQKFTSIKRAEAYVFENLPYDVIRCKRGSYEIERV